MPCTTVTWAEFSYRLSQDWALSVLNCSLRLSQHLAMQSSFYVEKPCQIILEQDYIGIYNDPELEDNSSKRCQQGKACYMPQVRAHYPQIEP